MPTLPLSQLDERLGAVDLDHKTFSLTFAQPIAVQDLLILIVRGTDLSIVPDQSVGGSFIGELKRVTVRQALGLILQPLGLDYAVSGGVIRVFKREPEMRLFDINYLSTQRTATTTVGSVARPGSSAQVATTTTLDPFADLAAGTHGLLSDRGTLSLDRKAGLLQVIDFPDRLDRVAAYLDAVHDRVRRQVQIDVRVLEVELNDPGVGLDWTALSQAAASDGALTGATARTTGLRVADVARLLAALARQGKVSTLANPRILALNNEPAILHASVPRGHELTLSVTPQVGQTGMVTLSLSPMMSRGVGTAAEGDVRLALDTLARVADGETVVLASLATSLDETATPLAVERRGRPPVGKNVATNAVTNTRRELLILLTPKILVSRAD